jgi:DNA-directed RNA polymerase subunit H
LSSKEQQAKEKRIIKGVKEILEFRGYNIKKTNEDDDYLDVHADKQSEEGERIKVIARFPKNPQIGVKTIRTLGKLQEDEEIDDALLISEAPLTHYAKKESVKLGIEIISSSNPLFNIFDHNQVPQHLKLKKSEIKSFLTNYQIEKHQIPKILETDPAVKAIQAKPGDVIRIVRNPLMGEHGAYYRVVIKSTSRLRLAEPIPIEKPVRKTKKEDKVEKPKKVPVKKEAPKKTTTKPKTPTKKEVPKKTTAKPKATTKKAATKKTTTTKSKSSSKK